MKNIITDYDKLLPKGVLFSVKEVSEFKIIKSDMLKKLIFNRKIEVVKIGAKNFISRIVLIKYLEENTLPAL